MIHLWREGTAVALRELGDDVKFGIFGGDEVFVDACEYVLPHGEVDGLGNLEVLLGEVL